MISLCEQAMEAVQTAINSQPQENRLTTSEANVFSSAMLAFHFIAVRTQWPAAAYLHSRDVLLESGWLPKTDLPDIANLATQRQLVAEKIVRSEGNRTFSFSEEFILIHPDVEAAEIKILGSESHRSAELENNSMIIELPREFWNVAVLAMASEMLWKAGSTNYSKQTTDYLMLNDIRTKGTVFNADKKHIKVSGSSTTYGRDGYGNYFSAEACGSKLSDCETPISFRAYADSRML